MLFNVDFLQLVNIYLPRADDNWLIILTKSKYKPIQPYFHNYALIYHIVSLPHKHVLTAQTHFLPDVWFYINTNPYIQIYSIFLIWNIGLTLFASN